MNYKIILCIVLLSFLSACNVLEQDPVSEIALDQEFKTEVDLRAALMGVYNRLAQESGAGPHQEMSRRYLYLGELRSDSYSSRDAGRRNELKGNLSNVYPYSNWQNFYSALRALNNILYYGQQIPVGQMGSETERNRLLGEAYFLRGFVYFTLLRAFDNVVLFTEPHLDASSNFNNSQVAPAETIKQIESDFLEAARLLPANYPASHRGRATRGAAHGFLSKFYAYISSPYAQQRYEGVGPVRWQETAAYADSVIQNRALYSLVPAPDYATIFTHNGTSESIWELVYDALIPGPNPQNDFIADFLPQKNTPPSGGGYGLQPSDKIIEAFKTMKDTIRFSAAMAEVKRSDGWEQRDVGKSVPGQKYPNHYIKKYPGTVQGNLRYSDSNILMLRLADVILLRAEALLEMGETDKAQAELNKITSRVNVGIRPVSVNEVLLQRWLELAFEGDRWYDLKRRNLLEKETGPYAAYPKGYTFPIINGEMLNNPNAQQNPGW